MNKTKHRRQKRLREETRALSDAALAAQISSAQAQQKNIARRLHALECEQNHRSRQRTGEA